MEYYTTGKFAKLANVSERTLRYYDKIGLLKPSKTESNGYRKYVKEDLRKLQKIILLKKLGFPLEEITIMLLESDTSWIESLKMQISLVDQKIRYFASLKDTMKKMISIVSEDEMSLENTVRLLDLLSEDEEIVEQYHNATNLRVRIQLHHLYSTNPVEWFSWLRGQIDFSRINRLLELGCGNGDLWVGNRVRIQLHHLYSTNPVEWFSWLRGQIDFSRINRLLELGCGNGDLWVGNTIDLRNREFFLSDLSEGMLEDAKLRLNDDFSFMQIDAQNIPFKRDFFDAVIANHLLFYLPELDQGLEEIIRVLKPQGILYASTYSTNHMKEITELAQEFDPRITLSQTSLPSIFGKENGEEILSHYFQNVERRDYADTLVIDQAKPIVDYIVSCHGNQNEILSGRIEEFYSFIKKKIDDQGSITVTKDACLFIATNKYVKLN